MPLEHRELARSQLEASTGSATIWAPRMLTAWSEATQTPLWTPPERIGASTSMARFMRWAGERRGRAFADYDELWRWSVDELEDFWAAIWEFCGVRASHPYERVLDARAHARRALVRRARSSTTPRTSCWAR